MKNLIFQNPIIAEQSKAEIPFVKDKYIGHTMPKGKEFIGESDYISLDLMISEIQESKKRVVLNIGDSSTSGWDSNVVTENRERLKMGEVIQPAFFRYKTYSDYLRDKIGNDFIVINAGVPAHTSLQGKRRLEQLVNRFRNEGINLDYVTIYYGNNDCVWELNKEDKNWLSCQLMKIFRTLSSNRQTHTNIVTRTSVEDYQKNIEDIIEFCRKHRINPVLIEPPIPIYWKPGTRVKEEELPIRAGKGYKLVYDSLNSALNLWQAAISQEYSQLKITALEEAKEKDFIVPRIKKEYIERLKQIALYYNVPLVSIDIDRKEDDSAFFMDYCHPIGEANKQITERIKHLIQEYDNGKRIISTSKYPLKFRLLETAINLLSYIIKPKSSEHDKPPTTNYPLY